MPSVFVLLKISLCWIFILILFNTTSCSSKMSKVNLNSVPIAHKKLDTPPLIEIAKVLNASLKSNFGEVSVEVVDCPNLTQQPFTLAAEGLGGSPKLVEIGGPPYLLPTVDRTKLYDLKDVAEVIGSQNCLIIGAGAGPHPYAGVNCEGIMNLRIQNKTVDQQSRISRVDLADDSVTIQEILPQDETRCALLANLFVSEGKPGKVLKVHARKRTGSLDFIASIREALEKNYANKLVGLGGVFLLKEGKAKQHVMSDFSKSPINTEEELNNWLRFYNMSAPLIAVGTLINGEGDLDLRVQHFHSFSHHGQAGHYHIDVTPETVEYLGYFNVGEEIYRIDAPKVTHKFGRD